jgi:hypothetical protein
MCTSGCFDPEPVHDVGVKEPAAAPMSLARAQPTYFSTAGPAEEAVADPTLLAGAVSVGISNYVGADVGFCGCYGSIGSPALQAEQCPPLDD